MNASNGRPSASACWRKTLSSRVVLMKPGQIVLMVMRSGASSSDIVLANPITPAHVATERPKPRMGWTTERPVMLRMLPPPAARMCGVTSRTRRTTLMRFCSTALPHATSSKSDSAPMGGAPSLFTRTCTAPKRRTVSSTTRTPSSGLRTSAGTACTSAPVFSAMRAAVCDSAGSRRALITTRAPSAASVSAMP